MTKQWMIAVCSAAIIICLFQDVQGANPCAAGCYLRCKGMRNNRQLRRSALGCTKRCAIIAQHCTSCALNKCLQCAPGYKPSSRFGCQAVSCSINNGGCSARANCTKVSETINCACKPGFVGDGYKCTDINECTFEMNYGGCSTSATCTNTIGSFTCTCKTGYAAAGTACVGWKLTPKSGYYTFLYAGSTQFKARLTEPPNSAQTSFLIVPCLAPNVLQTESTARCVSFQLEFHPGYYVRHGASPDFLISVMLKTSADATYDSDASFIMHTDQWFPDYKAFQSVNNPDLYLYAPYTLSEAQMKIGTYDGSYTFRQSASFMVSARPDPLPAPVEED